MITRPQIACLQGLQRALHQGISSDLERLPRTAFSCMVCLVLVVEVYLALCVCVRVCVLARMLQVYMRHPSDYGVLKEAVKYLSTHWPYVNRSDSFVKHVLVHGGE